MIKSIKLSNFFSFQEEEVHLNEQINILVGINGSGKSNLLKAIRLLKIGVEGNAGDTALRELIISRWGGFDNIYCKAKNDAPSNDTISITYTLDHKILTDFSDEINGIMHFHNDITYKISIHKKQATDNYFIGEELSTTSGFVYLNFTNGSGIIVGHQKNAINTPAIAITHEYNTQELVLSTISELDKDKYLPLLIIKKAIKDITVYNYFDTSPNSKLRSPMSATTGIKKLLPDGSNLPQILNTIKINHKDYYRSIQKKLQDVNEMFSGFDFNILGSGVFELMLDEDKLNSSVHITHVSDGTLRFLCLLAILFNPNRGILVCIDEPEIGLHPDMIYNISNSIREAADNTTFLIASHSENVLNGFDIKHIRIFEKDEQNRSYVQMFSEKDFEGWYDDFSLGTMWRAGDLGGKRW